MTRTMTVLALIGAAVGCEYLTSDPVDKARILLDKQPAHAEQYMQLSTYHDDTRGVELMREWVPKETTYAPVMAQALALLTGCVLDKRDSSGCQELPAGTPAPGPEVVKAARQLLLDGLDSGTTQVQADFAVALGRMKESAAAEGIGRSLRKADYDNRPNVDYPRRDPNISYAQAWALGQLGDAGAAELAAIIRDPKAGEWRRRDAIAAMGLTGSSKHIELLAGDFDDGSEMARAIEAMGRIGDRRAVSRLVRYAKEKPGFRKDVCVALGRVGDPTAAGAVFDTGILYNWDDGPSGIRCLQALKWQPKSDREHVYAQLARRDKTGLLADWKRTKRVLLEEVRTGVSRSAIETALFGLVSTGRDDAIGALKKTLNKQRSDQRGVRIANGLLNAGHPELNEAALAWGKKHGLPMKRTAVQPEIKWGEF